TVNGEDLPRYVVGSEAEHRAVAGARHHHSEARGAQARHRVQLHPKRLIILIDRLTGYRTSHSSGVAAAVTGVEEDGHTARGRGRRECQARATTEDRRIDRLSGTRYPTSSVRARRREGAHGARVAGYARRNRYLRRALHARVARSARAADQKHS